MSHALVLLGHADPTSWNARLAIRYAVAFRKGGGAADVVTLSELAFDPVLRHGYAREQKLEPDLLRLRDGFERASHVTWVFPTYWGAPPAIVKGLVDRLFLPGWAFRFGKKALPDGLLSGRSARVITTMDSPSWWYSMAHHRAIHASFGRATLSFVGFAPVRFTTIYQARTLDQSARERIERDVSRDAMADAARAGARPAPRELPARTANDA